MVFDSQCASNHLIGSFICLANLTYVWFVQSKKPFQRLILGPLYNPLRTTMFSGSWISSNQATSDGFIPHDSSISWADQQGAEVLVPEMRQKLKHLSCHTHTHIGERERKYTWKISPRRFSEIRAVSSIFRGIRGCKNVKESTRSQGFETVNIATTAWIKGGYTTRCTHLTIFNKFCGSGWKFPQTQSQSPYSSFLYKIFSS